MATSDPRIDAYIEKSPDFAKPILAHLRQVVRSTCPDVEETIRWRMPTFLYKGMLCGMGAFKKHCVFGFWKHELVVGTGDARWKEAMGSFGCLTSIEQLPKQGALVRMIKIAMKLNDEGIKVVRRKTAPKRAIAMPRELKAALAKNKRSLGNFESFSPSHRKEYMEWIGGAKGENTRARRVAQALEWLSAGKHRNWKYENC